MKLESGHEAIPVEGEELEKLQKDWSSYRSGMVRLKPDGWFYPQRFTEYADRLYNMKLRESDVIVMSFPKCGTTWGQEIVWTMVNNPDLNHPKASHPIVFRCNAVYADMMIPKPKPGEPVLVPKLPLFDEILDKYNLKATDDGLAILLTDAYPSPRTIKTHLPLSLNPPSTLDTCKVVYVARNPKDVIVSYHHQCRIAKLYGFNGSFEDFTQHFMDGNVIYGPYDQHVKEAWEKRNHPNLHFLFYEDLKANPLEEIGKLNTFLGTKLSEKQLQDIVNYTSFSEMKAREGMSLPASQEKRFVDMDRKEKEGGFFRKGEAGDWKNVFTPELQSKLDQWIEEKFSSFGISFK